MSTEENKKAAHYSFEEVLNNVNLAVIDELFSTTYVLHTPAGPVHGPEGFKQFVLMYRSAFPDSRYTLEEMIAEGDKVVTRWSGTGTHQGELMGIPPTGRQVTVTGISIGRYEGGKLVEEWLNFDALGMLQQLGAIPMPGQESK
jgi:steroid delta-isomerase-like uncharacterized protein